MTFFGLKYLDAVIDDHILKEGRDLDTDLIYKLANCDWIDEGRNLLITELTGGGKTYCGCALAVAALCYYKTVRY